LKDKIIFKLFTEDRKHGEREMIMDSLI